MPVSIDPRQSGLGAAAPHMLLRGGEQVAREGRAIRKFVNDLTGVGAAEVIALAAVLYNIPAGRRILISQLVLGLHTQSDNIHVEVGFTNVINGGGAFTPLTVQYDIHTGNVQAAPLSAEYNLYPLVIAEYSMGARCVALRVTANDVNAEMTLCWAGWWEFE